MTLSRRLATAALACIGTALSAVPAWAVNNSCANREAMLVGSTENQSIAASTSAFFATHLTAGRSYVVLAWTPFQDASETAGNVSLALFSDGACATPVGVTSVEAREPFSNLAAADIDAFAVIPAVSGDYVLRVTNGAVAAISHRIIIYETSLYSPWWFTGGSNNSFIILSNRSNSTTSVTVTMNTPAGTQCGTSTFNISANGNAFVQVNSFPGCVAAGSGSAQVAFISTPGTIQANTTVIDGVQGISFDAPFFPRMAWVITER